MPLTQQTMANYRSRLRKLRAVLPIMFENDPDRPRVLREIEKLTNQLGMEMTDLEIAMKRGPGRPRLNADTVMYDTAVKDVKTEREPTVEEIAVAKALTLQQLRDRVKQHSPELVARYEQTDAERKSAEELAKMIETANDELIQQGGDKPNENRGG